GGLAATRQRRQPAAQRKQASQHVELSCCPPHPYLPHQTKPQSAPDPRSAVLPAARTQQADSGVSPATARLRSLAADRQAESHTEPQIVELIDRPLVLPSRRAAEEAGVPPTAPPVHP